MRLAPVERENGTVVRNKRHFMEVGFARAILIMCKSATLSHVLWIVCGDHGVRLQTAQKPVAVEQKSGAGDTMCMWPMVVNHVSVMLTSCFHATCSIALLIAHGMTGTIGAHAPQAAEVALRRLCVLTPRWHAGAVPMRRAMEATHGSQHVVKIHAPQVWYSRQSHQLCYGDTETRRGFQRGNFCLQPALSRNDEWQKQILAVSRTDAMSVACA